MGLPGLGGVLGVSQQTGSGARQCCVSFSERCAGAHLCCGEDVAGSGGWEVTAEQKMQWEEHIALKGSL